MHLIGLRPIAASFGAIAVLAASLAGCPRDAEQTASNRAREAARQQRAAGDPLADMVSAVSGGRVSPPVELKFALAQRPEVGQPVEVRIAVLPVSPLDSVAATFQAGAGLELREGRQLEAVRKPQPGVPIAHRLTIVPERDGIFFVTATVLADSPEQSLTRTFSIPIIAGQGLDKPQKAAGSSQREPKPQSR